MLNRPVRVCFMIDRLYPGGTETQLLALIQRFDRERVQPYLCLLDGEDEISRAMEPAECPVLRLGVRSLHRPGSVSQAWRLARFLQRERIEVLQVYFPDSTYLGVPVGRLAGVPYVLRTRNNVNHWMTPLHRFLGRLLNRWVTGTVTNCEASRQAVLADEGPAPESVIVMETGVDLERFAAIPTFGATEKACRRVGVVANLRPVKGLETFVDAAARVASRHLDVTFTIAGDGDLRDALRDQGDSLGLGDRLDLPGSVTDIPALLRTLDIAVLCSHAEGMSNAVLEYMGAGRPIIATAVGGTRQLIDDGVHGLLVPPGDCSALGDAMQRLLTDRVLSRRLATAARRRVAEQYSRAVRVHSLENLYHRLVAEGRLQVHANRPRPLAAQPG